MNQNFPIQSQRLYCRHFTMDDLEGFHGLNGNEEVMKYIRPVTTFEESKEKLINSIAEYETKPELLRFALVEKESNKFVGCFVIFPLDKEHTDEQGFQVGYSLLVEHWGKGFATEITHAGIEYAFNEMKLDAVFAVTTNNHAASQHVLIKNGFKLIKEYKEDEADLHLYKKENK